VSPLRAVLLDAGGTLFVERRPRARMYAEVARRHGVTCDEAAIGAAMAEVHRTLPVRVDGSFRYTRPWFERYIAAVFARAGAPAVPAGVAPDLFAAFADPASFRVFDEVPPLLDALRRAGLRLAVVSNWSPALGEVLDGLGLARRFDAVVSSGREQIEKPAPGIFTIALERLGVPAAAALHVGDDRGKDVEGARAAGLRAALLDRSGADRSAWTTLAPLGEVATGNSPG